MNKHHFILTATFLLLCLLAMKLEGPNLYKSRWKYDVTNLN